MLFNLLAAATVGLKLLYFWYFARRDIVKAAWVMLATYVGYAVVEAWIWLDDSSKWSMLAFVGLDIAALGAAGAALGGVYADRKRGPWVGE